MLFLTNRVLKQSSLSRVGRSVDFDLRDTSALASFFCCEREGPEKYVEIGSARVPAAAEGIGCRTDLDLHPRVQQPTGGAVFPRVEQLQRLFDEQLRG
jgi:hypothetical protein